jgi:RNA polymerase sigma factor (sigma-70 family)
VIDETLIAACKEKSRNAQRQLYDLMANRLYHTCKRYLKHEHEIEEVLADTFYTIFTKLDQLKEVGAFEAWARRIAVNFCLSALRKKGNMTAYLEELPHEPPMHFVHPNGLGEKDLLKLLDKLPEGCRMVFNLFAIEGYSHKEIAALLHISEGTSKSQLSFSKSKLRSLVNQFYFLNEN